MNPDYPMAANIQNLIFKYKIVILLITTIFSRHAPNKHPILVQLSPYPCVNVLYFCHCVIFLDGMVQKMKTYYIT